MAASLHTSIPLLASIALLLTVANAASPPRRRTSFNYNFNGGGIVSGLTLQGDAHFPSGTTYLRLIKTDASGNGQPDSIGRVLYSKPILFSGRRGARASFETNLRFIINPNKGDPNPPADGLAFFLAPVNSTIAAGGGNFGVFDPDGKKPSVMAVEFDIYTNSEWDPNYPHVGIDIEFRVSSNVSTPVDGIVGKEVTARIKYNADTHLISVNGSAGGQAFEVSYMRNLTAILPEEIQAGISAATGSFVAVADIKRWSFRSTLRRPHCEDHI